MYAWTSIFMAINFGLVLAIISMTCGAEDMLKKDGVDYIGWQKSKDEFRTCKDDLILVGDGTVESTRKKCKIPFLTVGSPLEISGVVLAVDLNSQMIKTKSAKGEMRDFFVSKGVAESNKVNLKTIEIGNKVNVTGIVFDDGWAIAQEVSIGDYAIK